MRIALLQVQLDPKSRSRNVQALCQAFDRGASHQPAPDLLVLPGACDTGGAIPRDSLSEAASARLVETVAARAREWGVYAVVGYHRPGPDGLVAVTVLIDPDGDCIAEALAPQRCGAAEGVVCVTPIGVVALSGVSSRPAVACEPPMEYGALVVDALRAYVDGEELGAEADRLAWLPDGMNGAVWAQVSAAGCGDGVTGVVGRDGEALATVASGEEEMLHVEVDVRPVPCAVLEKLAAQPGEAD